MTAARRAVLALAMSAAFGVTWPTLLRASDKTIGLLAVPELMPGDSCEPFPPATVPLYAARGGRPIGELRGAGRPATATVCEFTEVRAVIGRSSFEMATDEHGYEERALIVTATAPGWYRVFTGGRPELVWIKATPRSVYRPLKDLFEDSLTYLTDDWDRRLYTSPFGAFTRVPKPAGAEAPVEQTVEVHEVHGGQGRVLGTRHVRRWL